MKYYSVMVDRNVTQWIQLDVEAENETEAKEIALERAAVASDSEWETCGDATDADFTVGEVELEGADHFGGQQQ